MNAALEKKESIKRDNRLASGAGKSAQIHVDQNHHQTQRIPWYRLISTLTMLIAIAMHPLVQSEAHAHGFNANHVDIVKTFGRKYRVIIKYTHVELGEYREAHIDFDKKEDAIKAFQDLAKGADFFLGDVKKSIHFHTPPEGNSPY